MKKVFKKAHKMTREFVKEYEVDYQVQFGLFVQYLLEEKDNNEIDYETAEIKTWFLVNNFSNEEKYVIEVSDREIVRETEKAVNIKFTSKYGAIYSWIPKSVFVTKEEIEERQKRFEEGKRRYEKLVEYAKGKVKGVRVGWRKETIVRKLKEAGYEVPAVA